MASFLGVSIRTAIRYEREGLPVCRLVVHVGGRGVVRARRADVCAWLTSRLIEGRPSVAA